MYVDKAWDGIFFLLTGQSFDTFDEAVEPLSWILCAPNTLDPEQDMGYGPANYMTAEQTKELNAELSKLSLEEIEARYNSKKMLELEVYPEIWADDEKEGLVYLMSHLIPLKDFINDAALANQAVIMYIN